MSIIVANVPLPARARRLPNSRTIGLAFVLALLVVWQIISVTGVIDAALLPPVSTILRAWYAAISAGKLIGPLAETLQHMFAGYLLAIIVGTIVGVLMGSSRFVYALLEPLIELVRPVPIPAFIPLLILFLGIAGQLKIAVVFIGSVFPIIISSLAGVRGVSRTMRETASTFRLSRWDTIREITVPAAAPVIMVGLRTSLAIALIVDVVSEMIAGTGGIGYFILQAEEALRVVDMYVGIFTLALVGYALNSCFLLVERKLLFWHAGSTAKAGTN
jgi:ABC-type nitrate/sulfonate/bicarbonate transport system permease component